MSFFKRIALLCLAAAIVFTTGCAGADTSWVYEYGGDRMPAGYYISLQMDAVSQAQLKLVENVEYDENFKFPTQKEALKATIEGVSGREWVDAKIRTAVNEYYAVGQELGRLGLTLSENEEAISKASANNIWASYGSFYEKNGVSLSSIIETQRFLYKKNILFNALYGENGENEVPVETLRNAFTNKYAKAQYIPLSIPLTQEEGRKPFEEEAADIRAMAAEFQKRMEAGESPEDLFYEYEYEYTTGEKESVTKLGANTLTIITSEDEVGQYEPGFVDKIMSCEPGKAILFEGESYIFVIKRVDISTDNEFLDVTFESYRSGILSGMKTEEFEKALANKGAALSINVNEPAIKRYDPSKLKDM